MSNLRRVVLPSCPSITKPIRKCPKDLIEKPQVTSTPGNLRKISRSSSLNKGSFSSSNPYDIRSSFKGHISNTKSTENILKFPASNSMPNKHIEIILKKQEFSNEIKENSNYTSLPKNKKNWRNRKYQDTNVIRKTKFTEYANETEYINDSPLVFKQAASDDKLNIYDEFQLANEY